MKVSRRPTLAWTSIWALKAVMVGQIDATDRQFGARQVHAVSWHIRKSVASEYVADSFDRRPVCQREVYGTRGVRGGARV